MAAVSIFRRKTCYNKHSIKGHEKLFESMSRNWKVMLGKLLITKSQSKQEIIAYTTIRTFESEYGAYNYKSSQK